MKDQILNKTRCKEAKVIIIIILFVIFCKGILNETNHFQQAIASITERFESDILNDVCMFVCIARMYLPYSSIRFLMKMALLRMYAVIQMTSRIQLMNILSQS